MLVIMFYISLLLKNKKVEPYLTIAIILIVVFGRFEFIFKLKKLKLQFFDLITIKNNFYEILPEYFNNIGLIKSKLNTYIVFFIIIILIIYVLFSGKEKKTNGTNSESHNYVNKYSNEWSNLLAKYNVSDKFDDRLKFLYFYTCVQKNRKQ